jgi:hypothetical protein
VAGPRAFFYREERFPLPRCRFKEALDTEPRAAEVLLLVHQVYAIEDEAKDVSPAARQRPRQERSVPVLAEIGEVRRRL